MAATNLIALAKAAAVLVAPATVLVVPAVQVVPEIRAIIPTVRLEGLGAAYWCRPAVDRAHLRWVRPEPEEQLLDALARLGAAEQLTLGEGTKYAGAFRAHGLVVPVWDVPADVPATDWTGPAAELDQRLTAALAVTDPLTTDERRSRAGLLSRQITLR